MNRDLSSTFATFTGADSFTTEVEDRNPKSELLDRGAQEEKIDLFERSLGFAKKRKKENRKYKTRVFSPQYEKDQELLSDLMNKPQYKIEMWKDNWGMDGTFRIFVLYSENLDYKSPEEKLKELGAEINE